jgi:hypothetical protein
MIAGLSDSELRRRAQSACSQEDSSKWAISKVECYIKDEVGGFDALTLFLVSIFSRREEYARSDADRTHSFERYDYGIPLRRHEREDC